MYSVYALVDPHTHEVRYVGMSSDVEKRFSYHMVEKSNPEKYVWIRGLKRFGAKPLLVILEKNLDYGAALRREQHWICCHLNAGASLFNSLRGVQDELALIDQQKVYSPTAAAAYLSRKAGRNITVATLLRWQKEKRIKGTKVRNNMTLYTRANLDEADTSYHW